MMHRILDFLPKLLKEEFIVSPYGKLWNDNIATLSDNIKTYLRKRREQEAFLKHFKITTHETFMIEEFNVFGCPLSTDVDVICKVPNTKVIPLRIQLIEHLKKLGYDTCTIDINLVVVEDGVLTAVSKGALADTNNMLLATYGLHSQKFPCFVDKKLEINIEGKFRSVFKYVLDNMKDLMTQEEYQIERRNRIMAYEGGDIRERYSLSLLKKLKMMQTLEFRSAIKALTMKMLQSIQILQEKEFYTKIAMAEGDTQLLQLLMRKMNCSLWNKFQELIVTFEESYAKVNVQLDWQVYELSRTNCTPLADEVFHELMLSPCAPTEKFLKLYTPTVIPIVSSGKLSPKLQDHVLECNQRTPEWDEAMAFYCTSKKIEETLSIEEQYHLIRGCVIEALVINTDLTPYFGKHEKITVGMLVEKKGEKCLGVSPDAIIGKNGMYFPMEIKCLPGKFNESNAVYRRAVELARKQLTSACNILKTQTGYMVLVYPEDNFLMLIAETTLKVRV